MRKKLLGLVAVCGMALSVCAQDVIPKAPGSYEESLTVTGRIDRKEYNGKSLYTLVSKANPKEKYNLLNLKIIPIPEGETIDNYVGQEVVMTFVYVKNIGEDGRVKGGWNKSVQSFKRAGAAPQP